MNWLYYIVEANIYLGVFYLAYCVFLAKETWYQLNRAYLVLSCVVSYLLPIMQIGALKPVEATVTSTINYTLPQQVMQPLAEVAPTTAVVASQHLSLQDHLLYVYLLGAAIVFFMLMIKLLALFRLVRKAKRVKHDKHRVAYLPGTDVACSFFNYLFVGVNSASADTIIRHELVHIRQRHSLDVIFLELLKIISWFNPIIYLLQNSLKTVHEYIADEQTAAYETDALTYSSFLVNNAYGTGGSSITHSFFNYNLLKKRIIMLNQQRSGSLARLKYLVMVPICAGLLCASTLAYAKTYGWIDLDPANTQANDISLPKIAYEDSHKGIVVTLIHENTVLGFNDPGKNAAPPLLIENGKRYELDKIRAGYSVIFSADSTTQYNKGNRYALATWGPAAENGVLELHGDKASVKISEIHLPETLHLNFLPDTAYKYPPPSVFKKGFGRLMGHLQHSFTYTDALRNEKNSFVGVSFTVKADRTITDINVFKKAGNAFDDIAKVAFTSFTEVVTAKPGKHTFMINYYSQKGGQQPDPDAGSKYDVNLVVAPSRPGTIPVKFPPPVVRPASGQVKFPPPTKQRTAGLIVVDGNIVDIKPDEVIYADSVTNYPANSASAIKKWGQQAKNGVREYIGHTAITKIPATTKQPAKVYTQPSQAEWSELMKGLADNIKYPADAKKANITGKVIALFSVDADHNIQYIEVVRSPMESMSNEVIKAVKANPILSILKPGAQYVAPVIFSLADIDGDPLEPGPLTRAQTIAYNPDNMVIPHDPSVPSLQLSDVVIRGYQRKM